MKEFSWYFLGRLSLEYRNICRGLRNVYNWSPLVIDDIEVHRLWEIYEETKEDYKKETDEFKDY